MNPKNRNLLEIHSAVLLFGMAGLFGKLISLPSLVIVFGRVVFAALFLGIFFIILRGKLKLENNRDFFALVMLGVILAIHWWTFFHSIQVSTVAVGLLTFSTFPIFVTFLEPFYFQIHWAYRNKTKQTHEQCKRFSNFLWFVSAIKKTKFKNSDLLLALITFLGVLLVIPHFRFKNATMQGALWGTASGLSFAILAILNKQYVKKYSSLLIAFYQDASATVALLPFLFISDFILTFKDILLLVLLGVLFTAAAHSLFIKGLAGIRAQTASIIACLEPLYGIIAAFFLLNEKPGLRVVIGGIIILTTSFYATVRS